MKENPYNRPEFYEKYAQMPRSKYGCAAAGEWTTLKSALPSFEGAAVLDLGCGYGWHCRYAAQQGAKYVVGVDISQKMLERARQLTNDDNIKYECLAMEDVEFLPNTFDVVLSSLALHYVEDYAGVVNKTAGFLKPGGFFVFSAEHPIYTASGNQDWIYDEKGNIQYFAVDRYFEEGLRNTQFLGEHIVKYHRTISTYLEVLLANGFELCHILEPKPPQEMMDADPSMANELRRPMMFIVSARKKS